MSMHSTYSEYGYQIWTRFFDESLCQRLVRHAHILVETYRAHAKSGVFTTDESVRMDDELFIESGHSIRCFFEPGHTEANDKLVCNKIGHALHGLDSIFSDLARQPHWLDITDALGVKNPIVIQSMVIFKAQRLGGAVDWHQDACFLAAAPKPVLGLWLALEDATTDNGCLWVAPGKHRQGLKRRYVRDNDDRLTFVEQHPDPLDTSGAIPIEVPAGSVVALNGLLPHSSLANRSSKSRCAMTFHVIDGDSEFAQDNWIKEPVRTKLGTK